MCRRQIHGIRVRGTGTRRLFAEDTVPVPVPFEEHEFTAWRQVKANMDQSRQGIQDEEEGFRTGGSPREEIGLDAQRHRGQDG